MSADRRPERRAALVRALEREGLDALLVTALPNIRYLTGFSGSAAIAVVTHGDLLLVTDFRYEEQARAEVGGGARVEVERTSVWDRLFNVYRTWADLRFLDLSLDPSDRRPGCYLGDPKRANYGPFGIGSTCTLRTWLSMWSLAQSECRAAPHLARISQPSLVVQATADQGCYPSDARAIFGALRGEDKRLEMVAGDHYLIHPPEARYEVADLVADWLARWR